MSENGKPERPYGPHGEGCTCDDSGNELDTEAGEEQAESPEDRRPRMIVSVKHDPNDLTELMFVGISDAYATHLSVALDQCSFDGEPLTEGQVVHIMSGLMRGHALARESANVIQANYLALLRRGVDEAKAREAAEEPPEEEQKHGLLDVARLFREEPSDN